MFTCVCGIVTKVCSYHAKNIPGLGGNTLTLIVTATRSYRNRAHGIYITAMAVADIIFLLTQSLNRTFVHYLFGVDIRSYSLIGCKIYYFFLHWSRAASSLSIALVCFERFVAIWLPWKANALSKRRVALIEICCIFFLAGSVSGLRTELVGIKNNVCYDVLLTPNNRHLKEIGSTLGMTIRTLIPTLTLLILTPPTVAKLICQRQLKQQMTRSNAGNNEDTFRVSLMLLSVVIAFCILVAPFCVIKHVYLFLGVKIATTSEPALKTLFEIGLICEQVNCVINFVLYVLISRMFRQRIVELLKCGRETNNDTPRGIERETLQTFSSMVSNGSLTDLEGKPI